MLKNNRLSTYPRTKTRTLCRVFLSSGGKTTDPSDVFFRKNINSHVSADLNRFPGSFRLCMTLSYVWKLIKSQTPSKVTRFSGDFWFYLCQNCCLYSKNTTSDIEKVQIKWWLCWLKKRIEKNNGQSSIFFRQHPVRLNTKFKFFCAYFRSLTEIYIFNKQNLFHAGQIFYCLVSSLKFHLNQPFLSISASFEFDRWLPKPGRENKTRQ